jgi:hypothetical protein
MKNSVCDSRENKNAVKQSPNEISNEEYFWGLFYIILNEISYLFNILFILYEINYFQIISERQIFYVAERSQITNLLLYLQVQDNRNAPQYNYRNEM